MFQTKFSTEHLIEEMLEQFADKFAERIMPDIEKAIAELALVPASQTQPQTIWGSREDAVTRLGISLPTLHLLMKRGAVTWRKIGRRTLIDISRLDEDLKAGKLEKYSRRSNVR